MYDKSSKLVCVHTFTAAGPSIARDAGKIIKKPRMVSTANMLEGVKFSPKGLPLNTFLLKMALAADVTALKVPA